MSTAVQQAPGLYRTDIQTLEGTLEYQLDGHDPITVIAGEGLMVPAETLHSIRNTGDGR
jgi:quercetin dioxygenase-like cupin family protein